MVEQKQIYILYTKISQELPEELCRKYLIFLPDSMRDKYFRYKRWQDRAANLFSRILLVRGLQKFGLDYSSLEHLKYTDYGRPYLSDGPDFNISHSGEFILCAIGNGMRLGIDIEQVKQVDFSEFEDLMTEDQWHLIKNAGNPQKTFFKYWSIKESIIKADGRGLSVPLTDILITDEMAYYESRWYLKELEIHPDYSANLASDSVSVSINMEYIELDNI